MSISKISCGLLLLTFTACMSASKNIATTTAPQPPSHSPRVAEDLLTYDKTVEDMNNAFAAQPVARNTVESVKAKLKHMYDVDQFMRNYSDTPFHKNYDENEKREFQAPYMQRFNDLDRADTAEIKVLLKTNHWFTISKFGKEADKQAWLLVQHADLDPDFQKRVLKILKPLVAKHETDSSNYAYLVDRVASSFSDASKRVPQTYGTQGSCVGPSKWQPLPSIDPENLDKRRAEMGLSTEAEYFKLFKDICH